MWVTAYYAGWSQGWYDNGVLPAEQIDYSAVTHIIHFALQPRADGTLDDQSNTVHADNAKTLTTLAHAAGKKVLICVGGAGSADAFRGATSLLTLPTFVDNLINLMTARGYDGIDIDWEPLDLIDAVPFTSLANALRSRFDKMTPRPLLTTANGGQPAIITLLQDDFDQINLMTYDMSSAWPGWVTWHNAPLSDGGFRFPSTGALVPSAIGEVNAFLLAGVPARKLGIGIDFYGYVWSGGSGTSTGGVTQPRQSWTSPPQVRANVPYYTLFPQYFRPSIYHYDSLAHAPYLGIDSAGSQNDKFISYDDETSCKDKIDYIKKNGLGGVIIWELGGGYLPSNYPNRDRLLQAIKNAVQNIGQTLTSPIPGFPPDYTEGVPLQPRLTWNAVPGATMYHLQVASDTGFNMRAVDVLNLIMNAYKPSGLRPGTTYYWRVGGSNSAITGPWSVIRTFTTTEDSLLPANWTYVGKTGNNATVLVPSTAHVGVGTASLKTGDAIGVFYISRGVEYCGGYGIFTSGQNLAITVWGDNPQTTVKDGFSPGDTIRFRIWNRSNRRVYAGSPTYQNGSGTYEPDALYSLASLTAMPSGRQTIYLDNGWNMISGYVLPDDTLIQSVFSTVRDNLVLVKDNAGNVYWPDSSMNTIGSWSLGEGYQVYMKSLDSLTLVGTEVAPEVTPVALQAGWNTKAYLRDSPMGVDSAFSSIASAIVLVKDNFGNVYWPSYGINAIGVLIPGQGYKICVSHAASLTYPANEYLSTVPYSTPSQSHRSLPTIASHFPEVPFTADNCILLMESQSWEDGDEIAVWASGSRLVGTATVQNGKVLVTIWGNDDLASTPDGANEQEPLTLTHWSAREQTEDRIALTAIQDGITDKSLGSTLTYQSEAVLVAHGEVVPRTLMLSQNFPNPFNPTTTIRFGLPDKSVVHLQVYNILGQLVATLFSGAMDAGFHDVTWTPDRLASGLYFCSIRATSLAGPHEYSATKKMLYIK